MGAEISLKHGVVFATAPHGLKPAMIDLRFPSVGATHQLIMAATLVPGTTVLKGCAQEPEIIALANFLNGMGADIQGAGGAIIEICGKSELHGTSANLIGDRIEAGTFLLAAAMTGGEVTVRGIEPLFLKTFIDILEEMGLSVSVGEESISVVARGRLKPVHVKTAPFPGLPTDLQAPLMAALTLADGTSTIEETVYEGRFGHVSELARFGANIKIADRIVTVEGVSSLQGAPVDGLDIRAAASLALAGIAAKGTSELHEVHHLRRGYEKFEKKMTALGARMWSRTRDAEDFIFAGC
jgi:UDP-N-acetylglucosamine 1-carboxyvinyltransferase